MIDKAIKEHAMNYLESQSKELLKTASECLIEARKLEGEGGKLLEKRLEAGVGMLAGDLSIVMDYLSVIFEELSK